MKSGVQVSERRRSLIFINVIITTIASSLLMTALNTALTPICADIGIDVAMGQWIISGEMLAMGIVMPLTAFLIRRFPTRRLYLTAIVIFLCGLTTAMLSQSFAVMIFGRVLQGCGNGILLSMGQVIILSIFPEERKGRVMGWYGLAVSVAPMIAPTLGGFLVVTIGWRSIFGISLIVMSCSFIMALCVFANVLEIRERKLDIFSFIISIFAFGGITLGVGNLASEGISQPIVFIPLIVGVIAMVIFVWRQVSLSEPFLDVRIFKSRSYAVAVIFSMLLYFVMMGSGVLLPQYVQTIRGYSALISGLVTLPGSLATGVISPFAGRIYDKIGIKKLVVFGSAFLILSNILMCNLSMETPLWFASICNVVRCVSTGCMMMPLITWGTSRVTKKLVADASTMLSSLRTIGGSIGSAVFVGIMSSVAVGSAETYGDLAKMHGMNMAFVGMTISAVIVFCIAVFAVKGKKVAETAVD